MLISMNKPAPFTALPPTVIESGPLAKPALRNLDEEREEREPWTDLPASGPRQIRVSAIAGTLAMRPSDREAARDFLAARASLGREYDRKRKMWLYPLAEMARHGVMEWASIRMLAALYGLELVIEAGAERAFARYRRHIERQLRPIPRVTWSDDDQDTGYSEEKLVATFNHGGRGVQVLEK